MRDRILAKAEFESRKYLQFLSSMNSSSDSLFDLPEEPSPRSEWKRKHGIDVSAPAEADPRFTAIKGQEKAYGKDENEALYNLSIKLGIKTWYQH